MDELANGGFQNLIPDSRCKDPAKASRVVLCGGKVYYDLLDEADAKRPGPCRHRAHRTAVSVPARRTSPPN